MMEKKALFIGRFQPAHLGHLDALRQIESNGISKVLIGIGSCQKEGTIENPFNYDQRKIMLQKALEAGNLERFVQEILPIPDYGNDKAWKDYIFDRFPKFTHIATGNPHVKDIFEREGISVINLDISCPIKASNIRQLIFTNRIGPLEKLLSKSVLDYIVENDFYSKFKESFRDILKPSIAVDGICLDSDGKIILIKRKNPPYGYAIPGGFVDYGEDPADAVIRELSEELSVPKEKIRLKKQIGTFGKPDRDPRGHVISIVYACEILTDDIRAGDDAKEIFRLDPNDLSKVDLAFDHKDILNQYLVS